MNNDKQHMLARVPRLSVRAVVGCWWLAASSLVGAEPPPPRDDEVTRIMHEAELAYQKSQYVNAGRLLQQAAAIVADLQQEQLGTLFPAPREGWQLAEIDPQSPDSIAGAVQMLGGVALVKRYQSMQNPQQSVQLALLNNPPRLLNNFLDLVTMTGVGDGQQESVTIDKYTTTLQCSAERGCHVILQLDNQMLLLAHGTQVSTDILLAYLRSFRFAGLVEN
jgi:hypothetical protein